MVAYGFISPSEAYLRESWCQLDFFVVLLAWLPLFFPVLEKASVIRSVRAIRPLRALHHLPGMPKLVGGIIAGLPALGYVVGLFIYLFLLCGVAAVQLLMGSLHFRCARPLPGMPSLGSLDPQSSQEAIDAVLAGYQDSGDFCAPHTPDSQCDVGYECINFPDNPGDGASFDTFGWACIIILQCISFDTWTDLMYELMDADSSAVCLLFIVIVIFGGTHRSSACSSLASDL